MKNIISEISRMKSLFGYQRGVVISEQYKSQEEAIYYTVARAVVDPGTNEERLKEAFQMVQNGQQFLDVEKMMRQRPISGYKTWAAVLKGEFSAGDAFWMKQYADILKPKGVILSYNLGGANKNQLETSSIKFTVQPQQSSQPTRQSQITNMFCSLQQGKITAGGVYNGKTWSEFSNALNPAVSQAEIDIARKTCPNVTLPTVKPAANLQNRQKISIPKELKDKNGVMNFQDWLDKNHPGWIKKYGTLGGDPKKGYGNFGPSTNAAWQDTTKKNAYLQSKGQAKNTNTSYVPGYAPDFDNYGEPGKTQ